MRIIRILTIIALAVAFGSFAHATQAKSWDFASWDVDLTVKSDSTLLVEEKQVFNFTGDFTWVTRTLVKTKGIWYDQISVLDEQGVTLPGSAVSINDSGSNVVIKVTGSLTGQRTFTFQYRALNALGSFTDHDELYWNAVSSERDVPVGAVTATVRLPQVFTPDQLQKRLIVGSTGSNSEGGQAEIVDGSTLRFSAANIGANQDVTLVAGWPKGAVTFQTFTEPQSRWAPVIPWLIGIYAFTPVIVFFWLFRKWRQSGRDPKGRSTIIAQYEPPDKAPPAVVGTLIDERVDPKDFSATLVDLAVRGHLRIDEKKTTGLLGSTKYTFFRLPPPAKDVALKAYEQMTLDRIFSGQDSVELEDLKNSFYRDLKEIKKEIMTDTSSFGYFEGNPDTIRLKYMIPGVILLGVGFVLFFVPSIWGVLLIIFGQIMPKKTPKGVEAKEWALGFKLYLHTAERFRVAAMTPETFERFLPYAMVFGVEKQWASRFDDIVREPPSWYTTNSPMTTFTALAFTSHLSTMMAGSIGQALGSSPSSSSGFGGGGFAGGGGGGGGSGAG